MTRVLTLILLGFSAFAPAYADDGISCANFAEPGPAIHACTRIINGWGSGAGEGLAIAYNNRGIAYYHRGDYDRAIADYDKVVKLKPDYAEVYAYRGFAYGGRGDYDRAISDLDKALELKPDFAEAYAIRGFAYLGKGDLDRAVSAVDKALELKPDLSEANAIRGLIYARKGDYGRAVTELDRAIQLKPDLNTALSETREWAEAKREEVAVSNPPSAAPSNGPKPTLPSGFSIFDQPGTALSWKPQGFAIESKREGRVPLAAATAAPAHLERRVALVVANAAYRGAVLDNPTVDADHIRPTLEKMGFEVTVVKNADLTTFALALQGFYDRARGADLALFYFAGHGFALNGQLGEQNYLMSTSADVTSNLDVIIRSGGIELDEIIGSLADAAELSLVFVDACRNDPRLMRGGVKGRGLARIPEVGMKSLFVGLSTRPGDLAEDGNPGAGSPFARAFAQYMPTPGMRLDDAFNEVRKAVTNETHGDQRPDARNDLNDPLIMVNVEPVSPDGSLGGKAGSDTFDPGSATAPAESMSLLTSRTVAIPLKPLETYPYEEYILEYQEPGLVIIGRFRPVGSEIIVTSSISYEVNMSSTNLSIPLPSCGLVKGSMKCVYPHVPDFFESLAHGCAVQIILRHGDERHQYLARDDRVSAAETEAFLRGLQKTGD